MRIPFLVDVQSDLGAHSGTLAAERQVILAALDFVLLGF